MFVYFQMLHDIKGARVSKSQALPYKGTLDVLYRVIRQVSALCSSCFRMRFEL